MSVMMLETRDGMEPARPGMAGTWACEYYDGTGLAQISHVSDQSDSKTR